MSSDEMLSRRSVLSGLGLLGAGALGVAFGRPGLHKSLPGDSSGYIDLSEAGERVRGENGRVLLRINNEWFWLDEDTPQLIPAEAQQ